MFPGCASRQWLHLWLDKTTDWQKDNLYLPEEAEDLNNLPCNPPFSGCNNRVEFRPSSLQAKSKFFIGDRERCYPD